MAFAVFTGDIIGSSELPRSRRKRLTEFMSDGASTVEAEFGRGTFPLGIDLFRGDSWQCYTPCVDRAIRIALFLKAWMMGESEGKVRTRISVGLGEIDIVPAGRASEGDGEAYRISGRRMEAMARGSTFSVAVPERLGPHIAMLVTASGRLIDAVSSGWTAPQSRAIAAALSGKTQTETARTWEPAPITQQAVAQHLERAGWDYLEPAVEEIDEALKTLFS